MASLRSANGMLTSLETTLSRVTSG